MRVLLSAYLCSPNRGSEAGVGWNWARSLSRAHDVCVLTNPVYRPEVEAFLEKQPNEQMTFQWVEVPRIMYPWHLPRRKALLHFLHFRFHYIQWLRVAHRRAVMLLRHQQFDVVHHVSYTQFFPPPRYFRLPIPFVLGPVGGGMVAPAQFLRFFGRGRWMERLRTLRVRSSVYLPSVRRGLRRTEKCLAANRETLDLLEKLGAPDVGLFLDCGLPPEFETVAPDAHARRPITKFLWAAAWLMPRKGLALGLEALARVADPRWELNVIGGGPARRRLEERARALGLAEKVNFLGRVSWQEMQTMYRDSDAFLFTSLRDTSGSVVLEAMASARPVIALDHHGVGTFLPDGAGLKVRVSTPEETITGLARAVETLIRNPDLRVEKGKIGRDFAKSQTWDNRAMEMTRIYRDVIGRTKIRGDVR